jgi:Zn-dependent protease with chaperone function
LQLAGVLAHELAHDDLGHVTKAQPLGAGLNIGMIVLDQVIPGSGALTPIAGSLIAWLTQVEGTDSCGFFATHPATADRIEALRNVH